MGKGAERSHPLVALFMFQPRSVIAAHAMLMADRAARGHDRVRRRRLISPPTFQKRVVTLRILENIGGVDAAALTVDVRQMREDERGLALRRPSKSALDGVHGFCHLAPID